MSLLFTNSGCYIPGFFQLRIDTYNQIPPINEMDEDTLDVFFHEYVHFLQDVLTVAGYQNIYRLSEYVHSVVNRIYKLPDNLFPVPFPLNDNNDNVLANIGITKLTFGDAETIPSFGIKFIEQKRINNYEIKDINQVFIHTTAGEVRQFGSIAIKESMAYLLEETCGKLIKSPDYPYNSARKVAARYSSEISSDPVKLIALCDMSLLCSNPASVFIYFLNQVKKGNVSILTAEDIVNWFYGTTFKSYDGKDIRLIDNLSFMNEMAFKSLMSYVRVPELQSDFNRYFTILSLNSLKWRRSHKYFMIQLVRDGYIGHNNTFLELVKDFGFPMMSNLNNERFVIPHPLLNQDVNQFLAALREIILLLMVGKERECGLHEWCLKSPESSPNLRCRTAPWKKADEERLCPYALLWKHWGLAAYTPAFTDDETE